jgi:hypothetical protein
LIVGAAVGAVLLAALGLFAVRRIAARRRQRARERDAGRQSDAPVPAPLPGAPIERAEDRTAAVSALTGEAAGRTVEFGALPITLGSDEHADVRIPRSREVAPRHAMLWVREGRIMLRHTGGVRQTLVSGRPVDWLILEDGDEFSIAGHHYRVEFVHMNGTAPSAGTGASR